MQRLVSFDGPTPMAATRHKKSLKNGSVLIPNAIANVCFDVAFLGNMTSTDLHTHGLSEGCTTSDSCCG